MTNPVRPSEKALTSANEILKLVTSLATGALVFSIGLTTSATTVYADWIKVILVVTWTLLFLAVVAGIYSQSLIPLQMRDDKPNISANELRYSAIASELLFIFGILGIAVTLAVSLFTSATGRHAMVATAVDAVSAARKTIAGHRVAKVSALELIKGTDASDLADATWHVQFSIDNGRPSRTAERFVDLYINVVDGTVRPIQSI